MLGVNEMHSAMSQVLKIGDEGMIKEGPKCKKGHRDWIIRGNTAKCSQCGRTKSAKGLHGYVINGPKCKKGHMDWFVGENIWRCSSCGRKKKNDLSLYKINISDVQLFD